MTGRGLVAAGLCCVLLAAADVTVSAQARPGRGARGPMGEGPAVAPRRGAAPPAGRLTAGEAEQLFDQFVLRQARVALQLRPVQVGPFGQRLEVLQAVRRRGQRRRQQLLNDLGRMSRGTRGTDEAALGATLRSLDELSASVDAEIREAYTRVEDVLDVPQRARFRLFEQRIERQKQDLLARARSAARGAPAPDEPADAAAPR